MEQGKMREKTIEQKLNTDAKKRGGLALKFVSPSFDGMPDRIVLLPGGHIGFVEVKAPGKKPALRITFVAPALPLPNSLTSFFINAFAKITAKFILPIK